MSFRLSPAAAQDIDAIAARIARDKPGAALKWIEAVYERCQGVAANPRAGVAREDIRRGLRFVSFGQYLILYRTRKAGVEIVRVLHGARQWQRLL